MSEHQSTPTGAITWTDLTVPDAESLRDFYSEVTGWTSEAVSMGEYSDFSMNDANGTPVAGICHARGVNAGLPPQWLVYITVDNLEARLARCVELGGKALAEIRSLGPMGRYCVIQDPCGAVAALFEPSST